MAITPSGDAAARGNVRVALLRELVRAAVLLADDGREPDQEELVSRSPEEERAARPAADPFADYYRQEADLADPCVDWP